MYALALEVARTYVPEPATGPHLAMGLTALAGIGRVAAAAPVNGVSGAPEGVQGASQVDA